MSPLALANESASLGSLHLSLTGPQSWPHCNEVAEQTAKSDCRSLVKKKKARRLSGVALLGPPIHMWTSHHPGSHNYIRTNHCCHPPFLFSLILIPQLPVPCIEPMEDG
jgi:hypothetical protein